MLTVALATTLSMIAPAQAEPAASTDAAAASQKEMPPPLAKKPPPYSLPWQLRPITGGNVVRSDSTVAGYQAMGESGLTIASTFLVSYKLSPSLAPLMRIAITRDAPPDGASAVSLSNPLFGVLWSKPLAAPFKLALFGAVTLPVGSGGGNTPNAERATAQRAAIAARSSMDNALYAVNDLAVIGGAAVAWVDRGLTLQAEVTVLQLNRVRGDDVQPDAFKTNFTSGFHAGYMALPWLSFGGELRYQRWLTTPALVANDTTGTLRDNMTAAVGVRFHKKLAGKRWLRPGISYARGLDAPMRSKSYDVVQLDVPFAF